MVLDTGSGHTKIGWSTQTFPDLTYPSVVGRPILRTETEVEGIKIKVTSKYDFSFNYPATNI